MLAAALLVFKTAAAGTRIVSADLGIRVDICARVFLFLVVFLHFLILEDVLPLGK